MGQWCWIAIPHPYGQQHSFYWWMERQTLHWKPVDKSGVETKTKDQKKKRQNKKEKRGDFQRWFTTLFSYYSLSFCPSPSLSPAFFFLSLTLSGAVGDNEWWKRMVRVSLKPTKACALWHPRLVTHNLSGPRLCHYSTSAHSQPLCLLKAPAQAV